LARAAPRAGSSRVPWTGRACARRFILPGRPRIAKSLPTTNPRAFACSATTHQIIRAPSGRHRCSKPSSDATRAGFTLFGKLGIPSVFFLFVVFFLRASVESQVAPGGVASCFKNPRKFLSGSAFRQGPRSNNASALQPPRSTRTDGQGAVRPKHQPPPRTPSRMGLSRKDFNRILACPDADVLALWKAPPRPPLLTVPHPMSTTATARPPPLTFGLSVAWRADRPAPCRERNAPTSYLTLTGCAGNLDRPGKIQ